MKEVSHSGPQLRIGDEAIDLEYPVRDTVRYGDLVVALLDCSGKSSSSQNLVAFDFEGDECWTAEELEAPAGDDNPYVNLWKEDSELWAASWKGMNYRLDPDTGEHLESIFEK